LKCLGLPKIIRFHSNEKPGETAIVTRFTRTRWRHVRYDSFSFYNNPQLQIPMIRSLEHHRKRDGVIRNFTLRRNEPSHGVLFEPMLVHAALSFILFSNILSNIIPTVGDG
jgi:hypothetical protein